MKIECVQTNLRLRMVLRRNRPPRIQRDNLVMFRVANRHHDDWSIERQSNLATSYRAPFATRNQPVVDSAAALARRCRTVRDHPRSGHPRHVRRHSHLVVANDEQLRRRAAHAGRAAVTRRELVRYWQPPPSVDAVGWARTPRQTRVRSDPSGLRDHAAALIRQLDVIHRLARRLPGTCRNWIWQTLRVCRWGASTD